MFDLRNMASAIQSMYVGSKEAVWTNWTVDKAVSDGYSSSGWVYKSVSLISRNVSLVPFVVKNKDNEIQWDHPITKLLLNPHPHLSRTQFFELLVQWLELTGNAYLKIVENSRAPDELWPISPDKIRPIESSNNSAFIDGYATQTSSGNFEKNTDYKKENVIHFKLMNPAQPLLGISPLQTIAKTVDVDIAQQAWNASAMQNRGVVEGVFTFKKDLDKKQSDNIMERIVSKFSGALNARKPLVLGSEATYQRLSLTTAEMDFLNSRKFNRDEIYAIFGIPPQLGGSEESSTYNNFSASVRIFWEMTVIPLLNLFTTQFTKSLEKYLENGYYIHYDLSDIAAVRANEEEKAKVAKLYSEMGVPFEQVNAKFELGFTKFEGWDKSAFKFSKTEDKVSHNRGMVLIPTEKRDIKEEYTIREKLAAGPVKDAYSELLQRQGEAVFKALENNTDPTEEIKKFSSESITLLTNIVVGVASQFATTVAVDSRGKKLNFQKRGKVENDLIDEFLLEEQYILTEVSNIDANTIRIILEQVANASEKGFNYDELRRAIDDTGIFSPERALRIARTEVGTAASIGQIASATIAGADLKTWEAAGTETREAHRNRDGEEVKIDERFTKQISAVGPRFPLDPQMDVNDRVNCDCFMTFRVE